MNRETIFVFIAILAVIIITILLYKYKKETLRAAAYYIVVQAEENFISGQGKEKLQFAIRELKKNIPWYISWLISETFIINLIEDVLEGLQETFKSSKEKQLTVVNKILETVTNGAQQDILRTAKKMEQDINSKGYVEGYLEGRTDFRGNSNLVGGIKAGVKL
ncbi:hypothetical protein [Fusobacterium ulcerans]|uniref:hypothetical protein n=1 Tax=Fusobacterium ulcerans TaxID=861 RepID=UPI00241E7C38|nr:hypothetical protein [Fusobacterium ulcerans]